MSAESNAMVPGTHWGGVAEGFDRGIAPRQVIMCTDCVLATPLTDDFPPAPDQVIIDGGRAYCLDHYPSGGVPR